MAFALLGAEVAGGEEPAEAPIGGAIAWPDDNIRCSTVAEGKPAADGVAGARFLGREVAADDAGERVPVGNGKAGEAQHGGRRGKLLRMRGAGEKREIRDREQLRIGRLAGAGRAWPSALSDQGQDARPLAAGGRFLGHAKAFRGSGSLLARLPSRGRMFLLCSHRQRSQSMRQIPRRLTLAWRIVALTDRARRSCEPAPRARQKRRPLPCRAATGDAPGRSCST